MRVLTSLTLLLIASSAYAQMPCERLTSVKVFGVTIARAESVAAGAFTPSPPDPSFKTLPAFCRVEGVVHRDNDTGVKFELWMPLQNWNGEFRPAASGFAGGAITYAGMAANLRQGWATANTNRGHDAAGPWKLADMTSEPYNAMIAPSKRLLDAFYGKAPALTLMNECGGGGSRDALQLVQDYPAALDAAAAVGFVYDPLHHGIGQMWVFQATHKTAASYIPPSKYPVIHKAALDSCDATDGLKDGIIEDPPRCQVDLSRVACKGGDAADCLTAPQIEAARQIYRPAVHAKTGKYLFAGMAPGSELQWEAMAGPAPYNYAPGFYRNAVFNDQTWDWKAGLPNFDTHVDRAEAATNQIIQAAKADIRPFIDRGGKLLLIGGWADHTLAPGSFVDYYESVVKAVGRDKAQSSVRLFMVPGMDHCLDNPIYGAIHDLDVAGILRRWKASGTAPETLQITVRTPEGTVDRMRFVCAYPRVAQYKGRGPVTAPASFTCRMP
ncbi:MAG TPA: tannase/feruloyl esterase family alpha/beta hydrolase [Vicinamibacterales bacterium]|nr:tannase/feruloyl esterase family alpha/beta hydrolase [Vicinamibacterales bacterium]